MSVLLPSLSKHQLELCGLRKCIDFQLLLCVRKSVHKPKIASLTETTPGNWLKSMKITGKI